MARIDKFLFKGYEATVIVPDNPNGKLAWKAEYLDAFENAEVELLNMGYTRAYLNVKYRYGSYKTIRLMHAFQLYITEKYNLEKKAVLFGMSIGGLYSFNYAITYPEYVEKVVLDNPVLDFTAWPPLNSKWQDELMDAYSLPRDAIYNFKDKPVDNFEEFFSYGIPVMLLAAQQDEVVSHEMCSKKMIEYCKENGIDIKVILKPEGKHHPHSLEDPTPIIEFVTK